MSNEVAPVFGGKVNVADMQALAAKAQESAGNNPRGGAPNGSDYMNFSGKLGNLEIGQEKRAIQDDELWAIDVTSFEEGWICWKGGKPASTRLANIYNGVPIAQPAADELGPFDEGRGEGWKQAKSMVLKSCDNGQQGYFKINTVSGVSAMAELIGAFSERAAAGLPAWPVVRIEIERFEAQGYKNFKPVFVVEGWLDNDGITALAAGEDVDTLLEAAAEPTAPKAVEKEEKPATKPAGRRRARG